MKSTHYSLTTAKRSLRAFLFGKLLSAASGFAALVLMVRMMNPAEYGAVVAAIAFVEIFYLVSGFGLSTIAQRYVAEYRVKAGPSQFHRFMLRLNGQRLVLSALCGVPILWAGGRLLQFAGLPLGEDAYLLIYLIAVFGCSVRYFDELFPALLLQGYTQALMVWRNLFKLAILAGFVWLQITPGYRQMLLMELAIMCSAAFAGLLMLLYYLRQTSGCSTAEDDYCNPDMVSVARRFYLVQILGQVYGPNTSKLIVTQMVGALQTAAYGFVQSLIDMLRNYLPAYLLAGWVRPLMVVRYLQTGNLQDAGVLASLIFKLSVFGLVPFTAYFGVFGNEFGDWISKGKYPAVAPMLVALAVLIALQSLHVVTGMITATVERPNANIVATLCSCLALPLAVWLTRHIGAIGMILGMMLAELIWVGSVWWLMRRMQLNFSVDLLGVGKLCSVMLVVWGLLLLGKSLALSGWLLLLPLAASCLLVALLSIPLRPFTPAERVFVNKLLPAKFFPW